jgi:hypothetical protein
LYLEQTVKGKEVVFFSGQIPFYAFVLFLFAKVYRGIGSFWTVEIEPNSSKKLILPSEETNGILIYAGGEGICRKCKELDYKARKLAFEWSQLFHFSKSANRLITEPLMKFPEPKNKGNASVAPTQR